MGGGQQQARKGHKSTHQFEHSQQAHQAQRRDGIATKRQDTNNHNGEIKDVPSVVEEFVWVSALSQQLDDNLGNKDDENGRIQRAD